MIHYVYFNWQILSLRCIVIEDKCLFVVRFVSSQFCLDKLYKSWLVFRYLQFEAKLTKVGSWKKMQFVLNYIKCNMQFRGQFRGHFPLTLPSGTSLRHFPPTLPSDTSLLHFPLTLPSDTSL